MIKVMRKVRMKKRRMLKLSYVSCAVSKEWLRERCGRGRREVVGGMERNRRERNVGKGREQKFDKADNSNGDVRLWFSPVQSLKLT